MSELGQSLPKWVAGAMSVLLPIATEERTSREVRKMPIGDILRSYFQPERCKVEAITLLERHGRPRRLCFDIRP